MNKQLTLLLSIIFLIGFISAVDISLNPEETYTFDSGTTENVNWTISGIDSNYLNISKNGYLISVILSKYAPSSNFSMEFYVMREQSQESSNSDSGGGFFDWSNYGKKEKLIINENKTKEDVPVNNTELEQEINEETKDNSYIMKIALILLILFLVCVAVYIYKKDNHSQEKSESVSNSSNIIEAEEKEVNSSPDTNNQEEKNGNKN